MGAVVLGVNFPFAQSPSEGWGSGQKNGVDIVGSQLQPHRPIAVNRLGNQKGCHGNLGSIEGGRQRGQEIGTPRARNLVDPNGFTDAVMWPMKISNIYLSISISCSPGPFTLPILLIVLQSLSVPECSTTRFTLSRRPTIPGTPGAGMHKDSRLRSERLVGLAFRPPSPPYKKHALRR